MAGTGITLHAVLMVHVIHGVNAVHVVHIFS